MNEKQMIQDQSDYRILEFFKINDHDSMATIKFINGAKPQINTVVKYEAKDLVITGIILSSDSELINNNITENVYECKLAYL